MRIGFLSIGNPEKNTFNWKTKFSLYTQLRSSFDVQWVGLNNIDFINFIFYWKSRLRKALRNEKVNWAFSVSYSKLIGQKIRKKLKDSYDILFAPYASYLIAFLNTDIPIVLASDATFGAMIEYYGTFSNLSKKSISEGHFVEASAL
jgi:hypothetical protein